MVPSGSTRQSPVRSVRLPRPWVSGAVVGLPPAPVDGSDPPRRGPSRGPSTTRVPTKVGNRSGPVESRVPIPDLRALRDRNSHRVGCRGRTGGPPEGLTGCGTVSVRSGLSGLIADFP